jgi:hypothetical protein
MFVFLLFVLKKTKIYMFFLLVFICLIFKKIFEIKKSYFVFLALTILLSYSCDQWSSSSNFSGIENKTDIIKNVVGFSYKSKTYSSSYEVKNDSIIVLK